MQGGGREKRARGKRGVYKMKRGGGPLNKKSYSAFEFANILASLDSNVKRTIFRFITIGKKL